MATGNLARLFNGLPRNPAGRLGRRFGRSWIVILDEAGHPDPEPPATLLLIVFLFCLRDRATRLQIDMREDECGGLALDMWYQVDGERIELIPPPAALEEPIREELERLAGLHSWRRRLVRLLQGKAGRIDGRAPEPESGTLFLGTEDWTIEVQARFPCADAGTCVVLDFPPHDPSRGEFASERLRRLLGVRPEGRPEAEAPA